MSRRALRSALALCLTACGSAEAPPASAPTAPAANGPPSIAAPKPAASTEAALPAEGPTRAEEPQVEEPPPIDVAQVLRRPGPPEPIAWRKVSLGKSSAEMPEPVEERAYDEPALIDARVARSRDGGLSLYAGDGKSTMLDDALVMKIVDPFLPKIDPFDYVNGARPRYSRRRGDVGGVLHEEWLLARDGMAVVARVKVWPQSDPGASARRVAWRIVTAPASGVGVDVPRAKKFLDSLGPFPKPKPKPADEDD